MDAPQLTLVCLQRSIRPIDSTCNLSASVDRRQRLLPCLMRALKLLLELMCARDFQEDISITVGEVHGIEQESQSFGFRGLGFGV